MHYYLYEIKNNINNKIYVGVHKTNTLNDGYMGSGKIIQQAIKKYGLDNFTKTILETFDSQEAMFVREREVVNEVFLAREDVYNLRQGGLGGFDYINSSGIVKFGGKTHSVETKQKIGEKSLNRPASEATREKMKANHWSKKDPDAQKAHAARISFERQRNGKSQEERDKISLAITKAHKDGKFNYDYGNGNKNNLGKRWIHLGEIQKMIPKDSPLPEGWLEKRK